MADPRYVKKIHLKHTHEAFEALEMANLTAD